MEQNKECYNNKEDVDCRHKDGDSDYDQIYLKGHKIKKRKKHISGDVNDSSCNTVKDKVQKCETLPVNLEECAEYSKHKGKKRRKKNDDNRSCMSGEQYITEASKCEELLDGVQHLVEERRQRKMDKKEGNDRYVKLDDISSPVVCVTRTSEQVSVEPETPVRESQDNGILGSIEMGICADNESSLMKDTSTKRRRKRTRRHRKIHEPEQNETKGKLPASAENRGRGTFIQSVPAARTHIRFADWDGDMKTGSTVNDKVEIQMEFEPTCVGLNGLQPVVTSSNVCAASSQINGQELEELKNLVSYERSSTKLDVQTVDNLQSDDLVCSGSSCNNDAFAKLLAFESFSAPRVYQRKKSSVTTNGTVNGTASEILSNTDVENGGQIKTDDKITNFSQFPILKDTPKEGDTIAFKVGLACNTCRIIFSFLWHSY